MSDVDLGVQLELELQQWNQNINTAIRAANNLDDALDSVIKQANDLQKALNAALGGAGGDLKFAITVDDSDLQQALDLQKTLQSDAGFKVVVDESEIEQADALKLELDENAGFDVAVNMEEIDAAAQEKMGLESNVNFAVSVDDAELERARRAYEEFEASVTVTVNVSDDELTEAKRKHDDLDGSVTTTVNVSDDELNEAKRKHDDLGAPVDTKVNVDDTEVKNLLEQIRNLQAVDIGMGVGGAAIGAGKTVWDFAAGGIFEMDTALQKLQGTTNETIPGARELIEELYTNAWGESRTQIAGTMALATQLGISQDEQADALLSAFEVASVTGEDVNKVLRTQDQLVKQGLVPSYREAGDVIVDGFQRGGNRADDLFDTLIEYGSTFKGLGLNGQEATDLIIKGMDAGAMNTDLAADALREFGIRARDLGAQATVDVYKELNLEDTVQGFRDGTVSGKELLTQVFDRMEGLDPSEQARMGLELFGTQSEDLGMDVMKAMNPATLAFRDIDGAASDAATTVNSDLGTAFTELKRTVEVELGNAIDDTFDISGLIDKAKEGIVTFADEIQAGEGLFGAIEVGFDIPGLEDTMQSIQRTLTEVGIGIMQAIADVLRLLLDDSAANAIDDIVADLSEVQLGADIFAADSQEEVVKSMRRALERGVEEADVAGNITSHFESLMSEGRLQEALTFVTQAQRLDVENLIDFEALQIDLRQQMEEKVNEALGQGDLITAANFAFEEGLRQELTAQISDTLYEGAMTGFTDVESRLQAVDFAAFLTGGMGIEALEERVGSEIADSVLNGLIGDFENALDSGDLALAQRIADNLGMPELQAEMDRVNAMVENVAEKTSQNGEKLALGVKGMYEDLSFSIDQSMVTIEDRLAAFDWAEQLIDQQGTEAVVDAFGQSGAELVTALTGDFEMALASGDLDLAQRIADNLGIQSLQARLDEARAAISDTAETAKEDIKKTEDASRISTEAMGESFKLLATDADESFTAVDETTGETAEKMGGDSEKMKDSVIGTAGELLLQSLAMGLSFLAISTASENTERRTSDAFGMMQDNMLDTESVMVDSLGVIRDEFTALSDSILSDTELLDGTLLTTQDYAVTWADVLSEEFAQLSSDFSIMVDSIQTNGGRLMDTLNQLSADIQEVDLSVEMSAPSSGDDSSGGDAETVDAGETINGMARVAIQTATADELKARDGYFVSGIPGDSRTYFYENGKGGYWSSDTKDGLFTYRPPKNLDNGGVVNEEAPESPYTTGTDAATGLADYLNAGGAAATTTAPSTGSTGTSSGSTSSGGPTSATRNQMRDWTKLIDDYTSDAVGYYEDFVESFETETEKLTGVLADLMMIQQIQIPSELLALASVQNNSSTSIQNNVNFYNQNAAAAANSAVNAGTALRGFGG